VLEGIDALVDKSLLVPLPDRSDEPRFTMLEPIRLYGLERLAAQGEADVIEGMHAAYFLALAETAERGFYGRDEAAWLSRLAQAEANLRAALTRFANQRESGALLRLAAALWWFWRTRDSLSEGYDWLVRAAMIGIDPPPDLYATRAILLAVAAGSAIYYGDQARAESYLAEGAALAREAGDGNARAWVVFHEGFLAERRENFALACDRFDEARMAWQAEGNSAWEALATTALGQVVWYRGDPDRAEALFVKGLDLARVSEFTWALALASLNLGTRAWERGDARGAIAAYAEGLAPAGALGDRGIAVNYLHGFAKMAAARGSLDRAARLLGSAAAVFAGWGPKPSARFFIQFERSVAAVRAGLDDDHFERAWAAGQELSLEDAIAEATALAEQLTALPAPVLTADRAAAERVLTPREHQVLRLVAEGRSNRAIAEALVISVATVKVHVRSILTKLDLESRTAAAIWAMNHGLAKPSRPLPTP
jgi:non-specific serine/threonine protein kinase